MFQALPHVLEIPVTDMDALFFVRAKCPLCHGVQEFPKWFTWKRDFCALGGSVYLVRCWQCVEDFTITPISKCSTAVHVHRCTDDEVNSIPGLPVNWGIPF